MPLDHDTTTRKRERRGRRLKGGLLGVVGALAIAAGPGPSPARAGAGTGTPLEFNRDIRPILSENCYFCHGPDKNQRKAELRLDVRDVAIAKEAFVPGKPEESTLVDRIDSDDPSEQMPPPKSTKRLNAAQKATLKRWIAEGAEYQPHWAYVPPERPAVPATRRRGWVRNPIDAFILAAIEAKGLTPAPEADRRTLLRRLSLDLTGLPPTTGEIGEFLGDDEPRAYERRAARLLGSPRYGERMASPWLDLVRFTDTVGYHGDQNQRIFPYRDYVIDAFNANKPFDRFTAEQIAGDLLPDPTPEQLVASGFNRLNMMTREGGAQPKEYLAKYAADRVRTVAATWLGSTLGCAECHDHKFDPFTTRDFYRLEAFFADLKQWGVYSDYGYTPNPELKGWNNDYPFPPEIEVASPYLARRREHLTARIRRAFDGAAAAIDADPKRKEAFDAWTRAGRDFLGRAPGGWDVPAAEDADTDGGAKLVAQDDGSFLLDGKGKKGDTHRFRLAAAPGRLASFRLEVLPDESHKGLVTRDGTESALVQLSATIKPRDDAKATPLAIAFADADSKEERYASGAPRIGVRDGWKTSIAHARQAQASAWRLERPVVLGEGDELVVALKSDNVGRVRLAVSPFGAEDPRRTDVSPALLAAIEAEPESRDPEQDRRLRDAYLRGTGWDASALSTIQALWADVLECRDGRAFSMISRAVERPLTTRVLARGNWQDESGEVVSPGVPEFLSAPSDPSGPRLTRLDLARWINSAENPLTARVFVNRLWRQFFGQGISNVVDDIGAQGEWPTHPELLDWLAVEFRESGWDVKHMVTLIVESATYRQVAHQRPEAHEADPTNRLLTAQSPRRLEAESVRDNALAIAGLLDPEVGGPSDFPYQPGGYYANIQFPDRNYIADTDDRQYRRGLYMHWQRTFLHPMLANFDAPSREECTATRTVANTPQQALTLLNDPTFVEASRVLAADLLAARDASDGTRIDVLFERALARPARDAEKTSLLAFLESMRRAYRDDPDDARKLLHVGNAPPPHDAPDPELAAWVNVCRVVLNLHETITRY